jgi:hypothetical protein
MIKKKTHKNLHKQRLNVKLDIRTTRYLDIPVLYICDISVLGTGHFGTRLLGTRHIGTSKEIIIYDLLIKGLSYQNKSYLQILMNCLFDVNLIKDDYYVLMLFLL